MTQPVLFGEQPLADVKLGPRQELVLRRLQAEGDVDADEAGALIHAERGKHDESLRCRWCAKEGGQVLTSLRKHGLVVRRRASGRWELRDAGRAETAPDTYNVFPPGF